MKLFLITLRLWLGTIFLASILLFLWGILKLDVHVIFAAFVAMIASIFISLPLLLSTSLLIRLSCQLPYSVPGRISWLGFAIALQNLGYAQLVTGSLFDKPVWGIEFVNFFSLPTICLLIVIFFTRGSLRKLYLQQNK